MHSKLDPYKEASSEEHLPVEEEKKKRVTFKISNSRKSRKSRKFRKSPESPNFPTHEEYENAGLTFGGNKKRNN